MIFCVPNIIFLYQIVILMKASCMFSCCHANEMSSFSKFLDTLLLPGMCRI